MSDDNAFELSRRKLLGGLTTLGVAGAASGAGTYALFSDTETSAGNSVQAGTLDLQEAQELSFSIDGVSPGETTGTKSASLKNGGSIDGDHVEIRASVTGEHDDSSPGEHSTNVGANDTARRFFLTKFQYGSMDAGFPLTKSNLLLLNDAQGGALVYDTGANGSAKVRLVREAPSGSNRSGAVHATSGGTVSKDYAVSMRGGFAVPLADVTDQSGSTPVTYEYYGGANNEQAAPDEVWLVVTDTGGNNHLVYVTKNDGAPAAQTWKTRDVGAEINGGGSRNWHEVTSSGNKDLGTSDLSSVYSGNVKAVGFGRGNTGTMRVADVYYDNLNVGGSSTEFRPMSLYDLTRGVVDDLPGLSSGVSKSFDIQFQLDALVGNDYQGDGVTSTFEFALAQKPGQDVL